MTLFEAFHLSNQAMQQEVFQETITPDSAKRRVFVVLAIFAVFTGALTVLFAISTQDYFLSIVFFAGMLSSAILAVACQRIRVWHFFPRTIKLEAGQLTVSTPRYTHKCRLDECWWFEGTTYDDGVSFRLGPKRPAIILVIPPSTTTLTSEQLAVKYSWNRGGAVACGLTPDSLEEWKTVLPQNVIEEGGMRELHSRIQKRLFCNDCQRKTLHQINQGSFLSLRGTELKWYCVDKGHLVRAE